LKRLEVTVTKDQSEKVKDLFRQMELLYTFSIVKLVDEECASFSVLIPDQFVDKVIDELSKSVDQRVKENTISVYNVEAFVSTHLNRIEEKARAESSRPNPLESLVQGTERYTRLGGSLLVMALFATLVALAGLFLDNIALVIGAMLLSPLLGPINAFAVNASLGRIRKLLRSQFIILVLLASVIALSAAMTFITSLFVNLPITAQITLRGRTSFTDIGIALILGCAGGLALFVAIPETLVGVAVAVALVPPASVTGIGLAFLDGSLFLGALILTFVYLLGLQLGSALMLRVRIVSPRKYYQKVEARRKSVYSILTLAILFAILGLIVAMIQP
jgi:uncharacterized hydrophobic protein (TIGR00341 family)